MSMVNILSNDFKTTEFVDKIYPLGFALNNQRVFYWLGYQNRVNLELYFSLRNKRIRFKVTPMAFATVMTMSLSQLRKLPIRKAQQ
jgi:hypothetical protein